MPYEQGPFATSSIATAAGAGVAWSNPTNAQSLDGNFASVLLNLQTSNALQFTGFGFSIPTNATITGIFVEIWTQGVTGAPAGSPTTTVKLLKAGVAVVGIGTGSGPTPMNTTNLVWSGFGGNGSAGVSDLFNNTWLPSDINASNFGFQIVCQENAGQNFTFKVDFGRMTVFYTLPNVAPFTVQGTAGSWRASGTGVNNHTGSNIAIPFAAKLTDGSANNPTQPSQNLNFVYGEDHTTGGGTTAPVEIACTPGAAVIVQWTSGLVHTGAGIGHDSAGDNGPSGSWQTDESSGAGNITYPYLTGTYPNYGPSLESSNSGVSFPGNYITNCHTRIGGLCGVFTDSNHNIIAGSFWDFEQWCVGGPFIKVTTVAANTGGGTPTTTYTLNGITTGGSNAWKGLLVTFSGFGASNGANNGTFYCTASATAAGNSTITVININGVAETPTNGGWMTLHTTAVIYAPTSSNVALFSIGIMDSKAEDNTGSFNITVAVVDKASQPDPVTGNRGTSGFLRYPPNSIIGNGDAVVAFSNPATFLTTVFMQQLNPLWIDLADANGLNGDKKGQIYPHGGQVRNGQVYPF